MKPYLKLHIINKPEEMEQFKNNEGYVLGGDFHCYCSLHLDMDLLVLGEISVKGDLEVDGYLHSGGSIHIDGKLRSKKSIIAKEGIWAESIYVERAILSKEEGIIVATLYDMEAGSFIHANGSIVAKNITAGTSICATDGNIKASKGSVKAEVIEAGWSIIVGNDVKAKRHIISKGFIKAGGNVEAGKDYGISAKYQITCGGTLTAGFIFAGVCVWKPAQDKEKIITCGKLDGKIEYGILKERT